MKNKTILLASFILSLGVVTGDYLIASKQQTTQIASASKTEVQTSIMLDIDETSKFLGLSSDEIKKIIMAEKADLELDGVLEGPRLQYIEVEGKMYFEKTNLLKWAQESSEVHRTYTNGIVGN